jgi:DNA-binding transcriptional ArsR family regulator
MSAYQPQRLEAQMKPVPGGRSLAQAIAAAALFAVLLLPASSLAPADRVGVEAGPPSGLGSAGPAGPANWTKLPSPASASPAAYLAMGYDPASGRVVRFGGCGSSCGGLSAETWVLEPGIGGWRNAAPNPSPGARRGHGMAFDPGSGLFILFGGCSSGSCGAGGQWGDTWTYDAASNVWAQRSPSSSPPPRTQFAMSYAGAGQIIIHGGNSQGSDNSETWIYNVSQDNWTRPATTGSPGVRAEHAMAYDQESDRVVLFGGSLNGGGYTSDTYAYDRTNATWSLRSPAGTPPARRAHALAHEPTLRLTVLFGGGAGGASMNDSWLYDFKGNQWLQGASLPGSGTTALGMAMDTTRGRAMVTGGCVAVGCSTLFSETWAYHRIPGRWTQIAAEPPARFYAAAAGDASSGPVAIFGGCAAGGCATGSILDDTWVLDAKQGWMRVATSPAPGARRSASMAHDPVTVNTVLFGGCFTTACDASGVWGDTWVYEPANLTWRKLLPSAVPDGRTHAGMSYAGGGRIVFYGGWTGSGPSSKTWIFDPVSVQWVDAAPPAGPGPRTSHKLAYDPLRDRVLTFGGDKNGNGYDNETWIYDRGANNWTQVFPSNVPGARRDYGLAWDPVSERIIMHGGSSSGAHWGDTWEFDMEALEWQQVPTATMPGARSGHAMAGNESGMVAQFGGCDANGCPTVHGDTWTYASTPPPARPPKVVATSPQNGSAGVALDAQVLVDFDLEMDPASTASAFSISPAVSGGSAGVSGKRLAWTHTSPFAQGTQYTVSISTAAKSKAGASLAAEHRFSFTAAPSPPPPPMVVMTSPANGSVDVPPASTVLVRFDVPMEPASTAGAFSISPDPGGNATVSGTDLTWAPSGSMAGGTDHEVTISTSATSLAGVKLPATFKFGFRTAAASAPPHVLVTEPADGAVRVPVGTRVRVVFDQVMDPASTASAFSISPAAAGNATVSGGTLGWMPSVALAYATTYAVTISTAARSAAGVPMASPYTFSFTVEDPPSFPVYGRVTDDQGAPVPGALVRAHRSPGDDVVASVLTDAEGRYSFALASGGEYYLTVTYPDGTTERGPSFALSGPRQADFSRPPPAGTGGAWLALAGLAAGAGAVAAALLIGGEVALLALALPAVWLYSRIRKERVLDHFVRGQIYGHIKHEPGFTYTDLKRVSGLGNGALGYHLYVLERSELIRSERQGRWKRYYPRGVARSAEMILSESQRSVLLAVASKPGVRQTELAVLVGMSRQNVAYHLRRLAALRLVRLEGWGSRVSCHLGSDADATLNGRAAREIEAALDPGPPVPTTDEAERRG